MSAFASAASAAGTWAPGVKATLPANAATKPGVVLSEVSCASPGNCAAVGTYYDSSGLIQGLLLSQSSGKWSPGVQARPPADASVNPRVFLTGVSCGAPGNCAAVGSYYDSAGNQQGLLLTE